MKEKIGKVLRQNKSIISVVVITAILFVYNTGMLFTGIWEGALYNVKAEEVPLKLEFFNNVKDDNVTL